MFDVTLRAQVTQHGQPFMTHHGTTWHRLNAEKLKQLIIATDKLLPALEKGAKQGGNLDVVLSREVFAYGMVNSAGDTIIPDGSNLIRTYQGLSYKTLCDYEEAFVHVEREIVMNWRLWAEKREQMIA